MLEIKSLQVYFEKTQHDLLRYEANPFVRSVDFTDDMSLKVQEKEIVALIGPSGCGKTTIARAIMGLIDGEPGIINGSVFFTKSGSGEKKNLLKGRL